MNDLLLIGIGMGHPDHLTRAGVAAIQSADVVLVPRKGTDKSDLAEMRLALLSALDADSRVVFFEMPERDASEGYLEGVAAWHDAIARAWVEALPKEAGRVALLVWGDPSLYDSTLRIAERIMPAPKVTAIPGITALQALTAAHAIPLNEVNAPVLITTGRQLRDNGWPNCADRLAVLLDGECSFQVLDPAGIHIWWGAFLGLPNEVLIEGPLAQVKEDIIATREKARAAHGWLMDTYLLARRA
ncbi:MAG: precorrin-6A synthase (deacetylating) [Paracoccaceae bacterium]|nr:precorrin-6A synthase (deacetylating) [Paracoccaceae bacterium]